jgi:hypothetical protein
MENETLFHWLINTSEKCVSNTDLCASWGHVFVPRDLRLRGNPVLSVKAIGSKVSHGYYSFGFHFLQIRTA